VGDQISRLTNANEEASGKDQGQQDNRRAGRNFCSLPHFKELDRQSPSPFQKIG